MTNRPAEPKNRRRRREKMGDASEASPGTKPSMDAAASSVMFTRPRWLAPVLASLILIVTAAVYWRVQGFNFVHYDDTGYVWHSQDIKRGLSLDGIRWAFTSVHLANWHPLTTISYLAEYHFVGLNPRVYHINNLILHLAATLALFAALRSLTGSVGRSAFVTALFALHPLHVESVAWVSERKDVLSGFFWMLTLLAYARYVRRPSAMRYALVLVGFALGLMSKPMVVTLPMVLLLLDFWPLRRIGQVPVTRLLLEKAPLLLMTVASCIVTFVAQGNAVATVENVPMMARIANAAIAYNVYVTKMFWPHKLSIFYPLVGQLGEWRSAIAILVAITVVALIFARKYPYGIVGWLWYLGTLVPVIGLIQVGDAAYADRYTYLPLIGLFVIIAWGAWDALEGVQWRRTALTVAAVAVIAALSVRTWFQIGYWRDTDTLFARAIEVVPRNAKANLVLGATWYLRGDLQKAVKYCKEAIRLQPEYPDAYNRLGIAYVALDDLDSAGQAFADSIMYLKRDRDQAHLDSDNRYQEAVYNMGLYCLKRGRMEEAERYFSDRIRALPNDAKSHAAMSALQNERGNIPAAEAAARQAIALDDDSAPGHFNLGWALERQGRFDEAAEQFKLVLREPPPDPDARAHLSDIYRKQGRMELSLAQLEAGVKENPQDPKMHLKLGATLQSKQQLDRAIEQYRKAIEFNPNSAARNNLAWLLATAQEERFRDGKEALRLAKEMNSQGVRRPEVMDTLAAAYAETGDFTRAADIARSAAEASDKASNPQLAAQIRQRLAFYEKNQPYRE